MAAMDLASGAPFQSPAAGESPAQKQETIMGNCALCGEPMPAGEEMFNYHGYSGPCPKPPLPRDPRDVKKMDRSKLEAIARAALALSTKMVDTEEEVDDDRSSFVVEKEWGDLTAAFESATGA